MLASLSLQILCAASICVMLTPSLRSPRRGQCSPRGSAASVASTSIVNMMPPTSDQAPRSSESPSVAEVWSTLSMSAKHSPCRWLLALRPVRHRSARRQPPCGSCSPEVVVGGRPEHEHQRREDRYQMNYPTRREEEIHQIRPRHELADGVSLGEPRDGADHDGKRPEYPKAYRQDEARPVSAAKHP